MRAALRPIQSRQPSAARCRPVPASAGNAVLVGSVDTTKPLYPILDPVRHASEMGLTDDQLAWLADIARPRCCHITGEHNPDHFVDGRYVCADQLAEVAWRLRDALGLDDEPADRGGYLQRRVDPAEAVSHAGCHWCEAGESNGR